MSASEADTEVDNHLFLPD